MSRPPARRGGAAPPRLGIAGLSARARPALRSGAASAGAHPRAWRRNAVRLRSLVRARARRGGEDVDMTDAHGRTAGGDEVAASREPVDDGGRIDLVQLARGGG